MSDSVAFTYLGQLEDVGEMKPLFDDTYMVRVRFREGDKQWAVWMTVSSEELAPRLFPEEVR